MPIRTAADLSGFISLFPRIASYFERKHIDYSHCSWDVGGSGSILCRRHKLFRAQNLEVKKTQKKTTRATEASLGK